MHFAASVHLVQPNLSFTAFRTTEPAEMAAAVFAPSASLVSAPKAVVSRKSIAGAAGECRACMHRIPSRPGAAEDASSITPGGYLCSAVRAASKSKKKSGVR